jgi:Ca2+-transporting ATPase
MQLASLNEEEAKKAMKNASVLARVTPELKLDIVRNLQEAHGVVSMTGDGVNDAPALKQANIGVAMGRKGTDLARSVSQMVITDDNFATIVKAIEQGRITYVNIQRAVCYLLTASVSSVITVALGIMFDLGLPLSPLQLLWLNLIMHIFPGLGIVLQKGDKSVMELKPRDPKQKLVSTPQQIQILLRSVVVSIAVLYAVHHAASISKAESYVTTFGLTTLSLCLLFQAWSWLNVWTGGSKKHKREKIGFAMVANMIAAYALLFAAIYVKIIREILSTVSLSVGDLSYCAIIALLSWLLCVIVLKFSDTRFSCSR